MDPTRQREARPDREGRPEHQEGPAAVTRRRLLTLGAVGVATVAGVYAVSRGPGLPSLPQVPGLTGPTPRELRIDPEPVDFRHLEARRRLGSAAHVYEVSQRAATYDVTPPFGDRLDRWLALHRTHVGQVPDEITSFGAWVRGSSTSWHSSGEAIDLARLRSNGRDLTSLRHDEWRDARPPSCAAGSRSTGARRPACTTSSPTC